MLIGTQTDFTLKHYPPEKAIEIIAKAGFDSLDFSMFVYSIDEPPFSLSDEELDKYFVNLAAVIKKSGLIVGQTHPTFPTYINDGEKDELLIKILERSIRATALLGCKYAVIHPASVSKRKYGCYAAEMKDINMQRYLRLYESLEKYDVYCAIENMFSYDSQIKMICPTTCTTAEELADYIDTLNSLTNSNRYVACLDVGHANLIHFGGYETVNPVDMLNILGSRIKVLHVQDTNGIQDLHVIPGYGNIDWDAFCKALKGIGYNGVFNLEADNTCFRINPDSEEFTICAEHLMYCRAKSLVDKYNL